MWRRVGNSVAVCLPIMCGLFLATPGAATVKFNFANVDAESYLFMANGTYSKDSYKTDNRATYKASWSAITAATLTSAVGTASASSTTKATFTSVSAGSVTFSPQTATINVNDPAHGEAFAYATGSFQYEFTIDGTYTLLYTHTVSTTGTQSNGTAFGQAFSVEDSGRSPLQSFELFGGTRSGNIVLTAGTYFIDIQPDQLNWSDYTGGVGNNTTSLSASFSFNLQQGIVASTVPEPASWMAMAGGFALVGGALRRRSGSALVSLPV